MRNIYVGLGSPTQPAPERAKARFWEEMNRPGGLGYAPSNGMQEAREAVCQWKQMQFGVQGLDPGTDYDGSPGSIGNVTFAEGSRLLLVAAFKALFEREDVVFLTQDYYNGHADAAVEFGLNPIVVPGETAWDYYNEAEELIKDGIKPKGVVTCYVSNPTGRSCDKKVYEAWVALAHKHHFVILDDYAYGALDYTQGYVPSILSVPGAMDVALWFGTASKMFSAAGWKVGYTVGRQDRIVAVTQAKAIYSEGGSRPGQLATATALLECREDVQLTRQTYHHSAALTVKSLRNAGLTNVVMPDGGMFVWASVNGYQGGSVRFVQELRKRGVIPFDDLRYGGKGTHFRWCLRVSDEDTRYACEQVHEVLKAG